MNMSNAAKTTLKRLGLYYLLLAINIIPCASILPDVFPLRNVSTLYLIVLSVCLIRYYSYRITSGGVLSFMMKSLSWMAFLLLLLRGVKYSVFAGVDALARHTWYLYYVPMLVMPLLFFYIALSVSPKGKPLFPKKWLWTAAVTGVFILLVLTNDLHSWVFRFSPGFVNWNDEYSRGFLFYLITVWQYALYVAAVLMLCAKCRIGSSRKNAWMIAIPFLIGIFMSVLLITGRMPKLNGTYIAEFPETHIFMVAGVLECCMQLGLIPTNRGYKKLFGEFPLPVQITDRAGKLVYLSRFAAPLKAEHFHASDGIRSGEHTILHKIALPGGFGFWEDDMTQLDRLNDELAEAKEMLEQEAELTRLKNNLKEKQTRIEQKTALYDMIASRTRKQSQTISRLAETAKSAGDRSVKEKSRALIVLLASYIKRYANIVLLSFESKTVSVGELELSFSEVLRYLNFTGIPGELIVTANGEIPSGAALSVFEAFGNLLTANLSFLRGAFVSLSEKEGTVTVKLTLENLQTPLSEKDVLTVSGAGVRAETVFEDNVAYIGFTLPEKGGSV